MITLLGLGPGDPNLLTREAWDILTNSPVAGAIYLRTRRHPTVEGLPKQLDLHDFDALYDSGESFEAVYTRIADAVIALAQREGNVIYAVPGHPLVGEATTPMILERARALKIETRIVAGLSFIEPTLAALATYPPAPGRGARRIGPDASREAGYQGMDPISGLQMCDALDLASMHHPPLNPDQPALIAQVYSRAIAGDLKLTLMNQYPPGHPVYIVRATGDGNDARGTYGTGPTQHVRTSSKRAKAAQPVVRLSPLSELDHTRQFDHLTSLVVPALAQVGGFEAFQETVAYLRAPEGCPWDREQTHQSLRTTLLEEAYEVLTAIDEGDMEALQEELGDLLLNIVLQAQIATEAEEFRMCDVIAGINAKLIRRHPHVFGDVNVKDALEVVANWNEIKKQEKQEKGKTDASALDGIAPALPALAQAQKMAHRAERAGFRWDSHAARLAKVREEIAEILEAKDQAQRAEEFGDLCFTIADWADGYEIDIETAAREANLKFARRFRTLEAIVRQRNLDLSTMTQADMLKVWQDVKRRERH